MDKNFSVSYQGWSINVDCSENPGHFCSFDVTDPSGKSHRVLGGDNPDRALERAKEMIDLEVALSKGDGKPAGHQIRKVVVRRSDPPSVAPCRKRLLPI